VYKRTLNSHRCTKHSKLHRLQLIVKPTLDLMFETTEVGMTGIYVDPHPCVRHGPLMCSGQPKLQICWGHRHSAVNVKVRENKKQSRRKSDAIMVKPCIASTASCTALIMIQVHITSDGTFTYILTLCLRAESNWSHFRSTFFTICHAECSCTQGRWYKLHIRAVHGAPVCHMFKSWVLQALN